MQCSTVLRQTLVLVGLFVPGQLLAVCLLDDYSVEAEFARSTKVVVATVMSERPVPASSDSESDDGTIYTVRVNESFRGPTKPMLEVFSENTSGRFPMEAKKRYLLFLYEAGGRLSADNCGNSGLVTQKRRVLTRVRAIEKSHTTAQKPNNRLKLAARGRPVAE